MYITSSTLTYPYVDMHLSEFGMGMGMVYVCVVTVQYKLIS